MAANSLSFRSAGCLRRKFDFFGVIAKTLLPVLATIAPIAAQPADVSVKVDLVAWGDTIGGLSLKPGEKGGDLTALPFTYSKPVSYSGPAVMEIYKNGDGNVEARPEATAEDLEHELKPLIIETPKAGADGQKKQGIALELEKRRKEKPNLVALAALPSGCRRATVLLAPNSDGTYLAYVIDDDPRKLPIGQLRVHNLSPYTIGMRFNGGKSQEMKTRASTIVPVKNEQISYDLAYKSGTEWRFQEHNFMQIYAADQTQMVILKSDNSHFLSNDGSTGGFLQVVTLRRKPEAAQ